MAKAKKPAKKKSTSKVAPKAITPDLAAGNGLVAAVQPATAPATVNITFTSGVGQVTVSLFRNGGLVHMQSIDCSSDVLFSGVLSGDVVSIVGVAAGTTAISISVPTSPATPDTRSAGPIHRGYIIQ